MMRQHTGPLLGWMVALVVAAAFCGLGTWQLQRMHAKEALLEEAARAQHQAFPLGEALAGPGRVHGVRDDGVALPGLILLDNQMREGRAGLRVYQRVRSGDGALVLVDLGWVPMPADRTIPAVEGVRGALVLRGLLVPPPSIGVALGPALQALPDGQGWLALRLEPGALTEALGTPVPARVLRLDPALPVGYPRDLALLPNTLPPERHLGYAVQWFGLAAAVLACAAALHWRRRRRRLRPSP